MSRYAEKLFRGDALTPEDWEAYLIEAHRRAPRMTPAAFSALTTKEGASSYQMLATTLSAIQNPKPKILDLACGDGHLVPYILKQKPDAVVTGIDMSQEELSAAQSQAFAGRVQWRCEKADQLLDEDRSFDGVLCHLAIMLMVPIDPVLLEIRRVLRLGGVFACVIGGEAQSGTFFENYQAIVGQFLKDTYPDLSTPLTGDSRMKTRDGICDAFKSAGFSEPQILDFELEVRTPIEGFWDFFKNMYLVALLPVEEQEVLKQRVIRAAEKFTRGETISFGFPMRRIVCT